MSTPESPFLPHGGYRKLRSYKVAEAVYEATVVFCQRFYGHDRRMTDQMVASRRSAMARGSGERCQTGPTDLTKTRAPAAPIAENP